MIISKFLLNNPQHLFVAAAGNNGVLLDSKRPYHPCTLRFNNLICVANSNKEDGKFSNSNFGKFVHVFAPGTGILSTEPKNSYGKRTGTSMAVPHVSGLAALMMTMRGNMKAKEVKQSIMENVQKKPQYKDMVESGGLIDLAATIRSISDHQGIFKHSNYLCIHHNAILL